MFVVVSHPNYPEFDQCVSIDLLKSESTMRLYNIFCISITYFIPLVVISISYVLICLKIRTNAARKCIRGRILLFFYEKKKKKCRRRVC